MRVSAALPTNPDYSQPRFQPSLPCCCVPRIPRLPTLEASWRSVMATAPVVTSPRTGVRLTAVPTNKNTEWLNQKAAWAFYIILIVLSWLVLASWTDPGMAWTYVHLAHGVITYFLFHWNKGSPIQDDQGIYDK